MISIGIKELAQNPKKILLAQTTPQYQSENLSIRYPRKKISFMLKKAEKVTLRPMWHTHLRTWLQLTSSQLLQPKNRGPSAAAPRGAH